MPSSNRPPSSQFYWKDWLTDPAVRAMSRDERGRFVDVLAMTHQADRPGFCREEDVFKWAGYTPAAWPKHREAFARAFKIRADGTWVQQRTVQQRAAQRKFYEQAKKGGRASAAGPRDSRGRLVKRLDMGLGCELERGAGTPASSTASAPASAAATQQQPTTAATARPSRTSVHPTTPRIAANEPLGPVPISDLLPRVVSPAAQRDKHQPLADVSEASLDGLQQRFPNIDVRPIAAQLREEVGKGTIRNFDAVLVFRCERASEKAKPGLGPSPST